MRRPVKVVAAATAVLLIASAAPAAAAVPATPAAQAAITLPRPTGPYPTGTALIHLTDPGRPDPLDPQHRPRELMVQLWYPSRPAVDRPLAPYAPPGEAAALQATYPVPAGAFTATTHSRPDAPARPGRHPVVFFHHGLCASRTDTTGIDEQLASLGFVVVALASTHESPAVEFPGGRVERTSDPAFCLAGGDPFSPANQAILNRLLAVRVADTRWVLDQLTTADRGAPMPGLPAGLRGGLETRRVGMFGHSFGGGTAAAVMHEDRRFVAGADLDGFVIGPVATAGLDRPFLVLGSSYHEPGQDPSWSTFLPALTGWHRWLRVDDAGHYRFIDLGGSVRKWGLEEQIKPADPETWRLVFGDIGDRISQQIDIRLTAAFFTRFLAGEPVPWPRFPQVEDLTGTV
jgi:predicted dienelactone hydrolase